MATLITSSACYSFSYNNGYVRLEQETGNVTSLKPLFSNKDYVAFRKDYDIHVFLSNEETDEHIISTSDINEVSKYFI